MRLLVANFFPAFFPPSSGGEQRYYYLYKHLSQWHDVTLLSASFHDRPEEIVQHSASFREYRVPKPPVIAELHADLATAGIGDECSALVVGVSSTCDSALRRRFRELATFADVIIHESPFTLPLDETAYCDGKPRVYASYNVECRLAEQMLKGEAGVEAARFIAFLERQLLDRADLVFATSAEDRSAFIDQFGCRAPVGLVPNGFELMAAEPATPSASSNAKPYVVFIGSAHPPNVEAAEFICRELAPAVPGLEFRVMGSVCSRLKAEIPSNVRLLGFVEEAEMRRQLAQCAAALNPLVSGSGTNLKMLQYMEAGAPILATPTGARGLELQHGRDALVCPIHCFAESLGQLVERPDLWRPLGDAARDEAYSKYSWARIAQDYRKDLEALGPEPGRARRKRLVVVNDFPVSPARSGGEVRMCGLLRELAVDFDVEFLCLTDEDAGSEVRVAPSARQRSFPKTREHLQAQLLADARGPWSVRDIVAADWVLENEPFVSQFLSAAADADLVIFEHPYLAPLASRLPPFVKVLYSSLNVEEDLKRKTLSSRADGHEWAARVAHLERGLVERSCAIVAVSEEDAEVFRGRFPLKDVIVIENGIGDIGHAQPVAIDAQARSGAVFLGSGHPPNVDAARFIVEALAPRLPAVQFHLIGSVCHSLMAGDVPENVVRHGVVDDERKERLLASCAIAINPMAWGGGSSLKIPDFLAAGLPLVSTAMGVRGFKVQDGVSYIEAGLADFADKVEALLGDVDLRERLALAGRRVAQRLRWPVVGARYRRFLRGLLRTKSGDELRLLAVTYRFANPAPGGAESYLNNMLKHLARRSSMRIDVAACDVGAIQNHWHFSALYHPASPPSREIAGVGNVLRFPIDPPDPEALAKCRALFDRWMEESRVQSRTLFPRLEGSMLMGGWNFPETAGGSPWRWSSLCSHVKLDPSVRAIRVEGTSPMRRRISLRVGGESIDADAGGSFALEARCPEGGTLAELVVDQPLETTDDPRQLGVAVQRVSVRNDAGWIDLDMERDLEAIARKSIPREWTESLISLAEDRPGGIDDLFCQVRGPHSAAMSAWLETHAASYDAILVQGVPFAPIVWASQIARRAAPVVLLPHFHVEDRYYHWKAYYQAFRNADCVLSAPSQLKEQFFDRIDARSESVAGGGIDLEEFEEERREAASRAFRDVHESNRPFVLVLGRKAAGKRYEIVLEALELPGYEAPSFDIVMIGPDEDSKPVDQSFVHYYGSRKREFVLGALAQCACLVNMSESESFGIVLLEAWAMRRPVVAQRNCMAFTDLVQDGVNGYLAESPPEVRRRIEEYLGDPALAARHAAAGYEVARRFSWESLATQVEGIVRDVAFIVEEER
jgi:glycosyltransferase involved in cell wall biosynthesis